MRLKLVFLLLTVVAMVALVAGCGGSSDSGSSEAGSTSASSTDGTTQSTSTKSGPPLTKAEFIKQGDAICEKVPQSYNKKLEQLNFKAEKEKNKLVSTAEGNLKAAVPPLYVAAEELEELTPPSKDEQEAEAIVDSLEAAAKGVEAKPTSELTGPKSPFAEFQKLTGDYGFKFCNQL
jgi:hypothetical protein